MATSSYCRIRNDILQECVQCSEKDLIMLKHTFAQEINSIRRLDNIHNVRDLINILEKRNILNEQSVTCLREIVTVLNITKFNNYFTQPKNRKPATVTFQKTEDNRREEVYALIASELGIKWIDFGRALKIGDAKIDELEDRYRLLSERIRRILLHYETTSNPTTWAPLLDALSKCRRNDLRIKVEEIFNQQFT